MIYYVLFAALTLAFLARSHAAQGWPSGRDAGLWVGLAFAAAVWPLTLVYVLVGGFLYAKRARQLRKP